MSVDDQLRVAFETTDESWEPETEVALRDVVSRHRRGLLLRRGAVAGVVAAAVAAGVVLLGGGPVSDDTAPDPLTPPSSPAPSFGRTVLQGRWLTEAVDETALRQAMTAVGDGAYADAVIDQLPSTPFRLLWVVDRGTAQLEAVTVAGREETVLDQTSILVGGDEVTIAPRFGEGSNIHTFAVDGDQLRLTFVSTTEPAQSGIPGGVWQRLLYDGFELTRE